MAPFLQLKTVDLFDAIGDGRRLNVSWHGSTTFVVFPYSSQKRFIDGFNYPEVHPRGNTVLLGVRAEQVPSENAD